jgi:hypothetical protein
MGLKLNIIKTEYVNIGSDKENMKRECNAEIEGTKAFEDLGSVFKNS